MGKYIVYWEEFYLGNWKIGVLEIISWEYASGSSEVGFNLRHWLWWMIYFFKLNYNVKYTFIVQYSNNSTW
jgi:hypothetical protein